MRPALHAVVPAAGLGRRMGGDTPKQYLQLQSRAVIAHSLQRVLAVPGLARLVVSLAAGDPWWPTLPAALRERVQAVTGGAERVDSVLAGLRALIDGGAQAGDWVMVHDAARPAVRGADIDRLLARMAQDPANGALLAVPVRDTLKRADGAQRAADTLDRSALWQAQTPQVFVLGDLQRALVDAVGAGVAVTDEASAMEWRGRRPALVEGRDDNLKITRPADLLLAAAALGAG